MKVAGIELPTIGQVYRSKELPRLSVSVWGFAEHYTTGATVILAVEVGTENYHVLKLDDLDEFETVEAAAARIAGQDSSPF